ncbi:MAG: SURF1 family protein [Cellulomonadaceae bacterium]|nr:SURF1 family protein [Cellulomonadaceae bacterium]
MLRRWASTVAVALLAASLCVTAGVWQWHRHVARSAAVALVEANANADPVPLDDVVSLGSPLPTAQTWRVVSATGHYLPEVGVLLRNRPVDGQPGFHVLEAFVVDDGSLRGAVLVVDRGWVRSSDGGTPAEDVPAPPAGEVTLVARLRADEVASDRSAPPGQVQAIDVEQVRVAAGSPWAADVTLAMYGTVRTEDGVRSSLGALAEPSTDLGPHLSYAFQWFVFALGALAGAGILIRRDVLEARADEAGADDGVAPPSAGTRARGRPTAEEEEDALLDAQDPGRSTSGVSRPS